jgi:ABC-2 type transport system ATP-binding protein
MTSDPPLTLQVSGLRKSFGDRLVLDGVDLEAAPGTVLALLGPNGAGKTTTVRILATLASPDGGTALVGGHDVVREPDAVRGLIGVTGQFSAVDKLLTVRENLRLVADLRRLPRAAARARVEELVEQFDLGDHADARGAQLSGGLARRLDLAMTLVPSPRVVFLDEPTAGLDPRSRRALWDVVRGLVADGVTVLLTTQYLEEADQLADTVVVLDRGRVVAHDTPAALKRLVPGGTVRLHLSDDASLARAASAFPEGVADPGQRTLTLEAADDVATVRHLLARLAEADADAHRIEITPMALDEAFLALTSDPAREALR